MFSLSVVFDNNNCNDSTKNLKCFSLPNTPFIGEQGIALESHVARINSF